MHLIWIGVGGFTGAIARYLLSGWIAGATGGTFPYGTLVINLSGSFALGLLFALSTERALLGPEIRGPLMIGFLGAYTTFSTLSLETWRLLEEGAAVAALANAGGSAVLGLVAVWLGLTLGRAI